jgi:GNAT superfamily N-acetyltransferase
MTSINFDLPQFYELQKADIEYASKMCARAFDENPLFHHLIPDLEMHQQKLHVLQRFILNTARRNGKVYAISNRIEALAAWIYSEDINNSLLAQLRCGGLSIITNFGLSLVKRQAPIEKFLFEIHHKYAPFPHMYLSPLCVEPKEQKKGYGSQLLAAMFEKIAPLKIPIYLETTKKANVTYYKHQGFEVVDESTLPGTDIINYAFLKKF